MKEITISIIGTHSFSVEDVEYEEYRIKNYVEKMSEFGIEINYHFNKRSYYDDNTYCFIRAQAELDKFEKLRKACRVWSPSLSKEISDSIDSINFQKMINVSYYMI
jgi:hypothetical protein